MGALMKRQFDNRQKGAAAVEFAIVLLPLVLLTFGIIEFSIVLYNKAMITNASREGVRAGIVSQNPRVPDSEIIKIVEDYCKDYLITFGNHETALDIPLPEWNDIDSDGSRNFGDELAVTVAYSYSFLLLPNLVADIGSPLVLKANTVMRYE